MTIGKLDKESFEHIQERFHSFSLSMFEIEILNNLGSYSFLKKEIEKENPKVNLGRSENQFKKNEQAEFFETKVANSQKTQPKVIDPLEALRVHDLELFKPKVADPLEALRIHDLEELTEAYLPEEKDGSKD